MGLAQDHYDWDPVANVADLPNTAGASIQSSKVKVGHRCVVTGVGNVPYVCTTATLGAAVWGPIGTAAAQALVSWDGNTTDQLDALVSGGLWGSSARALSSAAYRRVRVRGAEVNAFLSAGFGFLNGESFALCVDGVTALIEVDKYVLTFEALEQRINDAFPGVAATLESITASSVTKSLVLTGTPGTGKISLRNVSGAPLQKCGLAPGVWLAASATYPSGESIYLDIDGGRSASAQGNAFTTLTFSAEVLDISVDGATPVSVALNGVLSAEDVADLVNAENIPGLFCAWAYDSGAYRVEFYTAGQDTSATLAFTDGTGTPTAKLGLPASATGKQKGTISATTTTSATTLADDLDDAPLLADVSDSLDDATIMVRSHSVGSTSWVRISDCEPSSGVLTLSANFANNDTVVIGSKTYTMKTVLANPNDVLIGASSLASLDNLVAAINGGAGAGTLYHASTTANTAVEADTATGTRAFNFLSIVRVAGGIPEGESVTVGGKTYTFKAALSAPNDVKRTGNVFVDVQSLVAAINAGAGAGTIYHAGTTANLNVSAEFVPSTGSLKVTALPANHGLAGNSITSTETSDTSLTWQSPTLKGGTDSMRVAARVKGVTGDTTPTTTTSGTAAWTGATLSGGLGDPALGTLTMTVNVSAGHTVTIDAKTYTYVAALPTGNNGDVLVGGSITASLNNLAAAINGGAGAGTTYDAATTAHERVYAAVVDPGPGAMYVAAIAPGVGGNLLDTTESTGGNASWGAATLTGGSGGGNGCFASGALTASSNFVNGETLTIGPNTYTFVTAPPVSANDVTIGASVNESFYNLRLAINATGTPGAHYGAGTAAHPSVSAQGLETYAASVLTGSGVPIAGQTVTIDAKVYTFVAALPTGNDGDVSIGGDLGGTLSNLMNAINTTGTPGVNYDAATTIHPTVSATSTVSSLTVTANAVGFAGSGLASTTTSGALSWSAATLSGGTSYGVDVVAAVGGHRGNRIVTTETCANAAWVAATLEGGYGGSPLESMHIAPGLDEGVAQAPTLTVVNDPIYPGGKVLRFSALGGLYSTAYALFAEAIALRPMKLSATLLPKYPYVTDGQVTYSLAVATDAATTTGYGVGITVSDDGTSALTFGRTNGPYPTPSEGGVWGTPSIPAGELYVDLSAAGVNDNNHPQFYYSVGFLGAAGATAFSTGVSFPPQFLPYLFSAWDTAASDRHGFAFRAATRDPFELNILMFSVRANPSP